MSDPFRILSTGLQPRELNVQETQQPPSEPGIFDELLAKVATSVVKPEEQAAKAIEAFQQGAEGRIHETLMTVDKAEISLKLLVGVRNRLLDSYREIMRMGA
jgi:flagellar hook-basal body complex protein FliE